MSISLSESFQRVRQVIDRLEFRSPFPNGFDVIDKNGLTFIRYWEMRPCTKDPEGCEPTRQNGRKWYVSPHACLSEVVGTAFKAVLTFLEHEAREDFIYDGAAVYNGHIDVKALGAVADMEDTRDDD